MPATLPKWQALKILAAAGTVAALLAGLTSCSRPADKDAQVIWGARIDQKLQGEIRVMTIVTGVKSPQILGPVNVKEPSQQAVEMTNNLGIKLLA